VAFLIGFSQTSVHVFSDSIAEKFRGGKDLALSENIGKQQIIVLFMELLATLIEPTTTYLYCLLPTRHKLLPVTG
jgi:hypothetical protein